MNIDTAAQELNTKLGLLIKMQKFFNALVVVGIEE